MRGRLYKLGHRCLFLASSAKNVNYEQASFCQWNRLHAFVLRANACGCSTSSVARFSWEGTSSFAILVSKLEATLKDDSVDEAWEAFSNYRSLHGFPQKHLLSRMIVLMSYSSKPYWLHAKAYNLVLHGSVLKAQQLIELMSQMEVVADANSIIIIARFYEMIGQRDELVKLKNHVDGVSSLTLSCHYQQFYDCLLSLHFKYNDLDAAAELMFELYRRLELLQSCNGGSTKECYSGLILSSNGKLVPSKKALAKLIDGYLRERKLGKISDFLVRTEKELDSQEINLSFEVMDACIQLGLLETAHDILDDLELAEVSVRPSIYGSLLRAYCKRDMLEEAKVKMMEDAMRTYKRMEQNYVYPTAQTFIHIINGFSSLKMYREITIVWGDIKRKLEDGVLIPERDLFECLLWNFLRGGYLERVMETIGYMIKHKMFIDKWKYKTEFLKLHKDLYKNLKASHARTEAQSKRLEHVRAFRRWAGIKSNL
ncbi:hypothetical protein J5N97_001140 [Dioscorea zingiberensis]|uniref:Pentatricopeptide repeat-containing protein n=1 Tax=Dioscorea zingiberensis TaxID=325984 RepID=A0A9D5BW27_9LILI|nr:hypothetical protein J5N97_001140 [Dioscorea zingiberensis]